MKRSITAAVLIAVVVLAACSSSKSSKSSGTTTTSPSTASSSPSGSPTTARAAAGPTAAVAGLKSAQNAKVNQKIVVSSDGGVTMYMYEPDGTAKTSTVPAAIRSNWPAVVASDPANVKIEGLDPSKLGVAPQPDGAKQLTFNGHLLYKYVGDAVAGDANGQGLGGIWFVLSEAGNKVAS